MCSSHQRYFFPSYTLTASHAGAADRARGAVESSLHCRLDVLLGKDASRAGTEQAPEDFPLLSKVAFNEIKADPSTEDVRVKHFQTTMNTDILLTLFNVAKAPKPINKRPRRRSEDALTVALDVMVLNRLLEVVGCHGSDGPIQHERSHIRHQYRITDRSLPGRSPSISRVEMAPSLWDTHVTKRGSSG